MSPTHIASIIVMILGIVPRTQLVAAKAYAAAIQRATDDPEEQRMLAVIAWAGNWFHTYGGDLAGADHHHTPFFDVTDLRNAHPERDISIDLGATVALRYMRYLHTRVCRGMSWDYALGAFHGGHPRCHIDRLVTRQMHYANSFLW